MALSTYNQIKEEVRQNWSDFIDAKYPEDTVGEYADSAVPVYNNKVLEQWAELPYDWRDHWFGALEKDASIIDRMQYDLFNYYSSQFYQAFQELSEELADTEELV
jgi:hypothetical protein